MLDAIIVGAGVVGGLTARELTKYGLKVLMLEKECDVAMGATRANSAIVHAGFDAKPGTLKAKFNVLGSKMMEKVCTELGVKYKRNGSLVVGFDEADRKTLGDLLMRGKENGVEGLRLLDGDEVRVLEPSIGDGVCCALHAPTGAIICPYELCMAAVGNAMDNGAELMLEFEVEKIEKTDAGYRVTAKDGRAVEARWVINCAGVYSDRIAAMVGDDSFTVKARRGEYMLLDKECGALVSHTVFRCPSKMGKGILVSPTVDGNLLLGPTAEDIDDKSDARTTPRGIGEIRAKASEQVRGVNVGKVITSFAGLRAVGSVGDFIINSPRCGFINAAGIESPGLTSAPAIAEHIVGMMMDAGEDMSESDSFVGTRRPMHYFREMSVEEKNELIKTNPAYAQVVCRCEVVTEGEILEAIRTNPRPVNVDGVKRRTRATMGRCQGGFCTPYIVELLARELGIGYEDVKKQGGDSYINVGRTK